MNVVGKFRSLIAQGVYSVATPIHPFGGAVDIIVVQQQDGSFRTTPWYVRFGKFQGVLKGAEKIVRIEVNGVEADFHMFLDNSGEAYFIRETVSRKDSEGNEGLKDSDNLGSTQDDCGVDYNDNGDSKKEKVSHYRHQGSVSTDVEVLQDEHIALGVDQIERPESDSERGLYEFQDDQSSIGDSLELSEYGSSRYENLDSVKHLVESQNSNSEVVLVSVDGHILTAPISSSERNIENVQLEMETPQFHLGPGEGTEFCEGDAEFNTGETTWAADYFSDMNASTSKVVSENLSNVNMCSDAPANQLEVHEGNEKDVCQEQTTQNTGNQESEHCVRSSSDDAPTTIKREDVFKSCLELQELALQVGDANQQERDSSLAIQGGVEDEPDKSPQSLPPTSETEDGGVGESISSNILSVSISDVPSCISSPNLQDEVESVETNALGADQNLSDSIFIHSVSNDQELEVHIGRGPIQSNPQEPASIVETIGTDALGTDQNLSVSVSNFQELEELVGREEAQSSPEERASEGECSKSKTEEPHTGSSSEEKKTESNTRFEISLCGNLLSAGMGLSAAAEAFNAHCISEDEFRRSAASIIKNENLVVRFQERYLPWDKAAPIVLGKAAYGLDLPLEPYDTIPVDEDETLKHREDESGITSTPSGRTWRLWPIAFRRVKPLEHAHSNSSSEDVFVDSESGSLNIPVDLIPPSHGGSESPQKQLLRTNVPTTEQIASLKLKEGQNMVSFIFSTRVLGIQKVDAHIYLWKWNARIVISDVDGTITKSDVLGQFMPLVGKDWTQSGVARLFSAIKENGYQLLFLSARAIVQAYLTRSFLVNLKQDGKALPHGPVVISPDGLFPSLYREVIRRAPHEFKIACLEDIKALFPSDYNPFYAGFGNRDTDELSYRKIGIPKGKIFIINPKGEVAISHRIDAKSYTSLHTLVNDMFPPTSMVEQEDYNSWNYWKMPLPGIVDL